MADFKLFWPILLKQEGYYSNAKNDSGRETWEGISRNNYPSWTGWSIIDSYKGKPNFPSILKLDIVLQSKVIAFYKTSQWDIIEGDLITNQSIANFIADWGVNSGMSVPVKHVQKTLGLNDDGKVGAHTITAINAADGQSLFNQLKQQRIDFYHAVVAAHPEDKEFLSNWLERTNSFTYTP